MLRSYWILLSHYHIIHSYAKCRVIGPKHAGFHGKSKMLISNIIHLTRKFDSERADKIRVKFPHQNYYKVNQWIAQNASVAVFLQWNLETCLMPNFSGITFLTDAAPEFLCMLNFLPVVIHLIPVFNFSTICCKMYVDCSHFVTASIS